LNRKKIIS